jgi:hypothetical protein
MSHADYDNQDANQPPNIVFQTSIPPSDIVTQPPDNGYPKERKEKKERKEAGKNNCITPESPLPRVLRRKSYRLTTF